MLNRMRKTDHQDERYVRQTMLPEIGAGGQEKLRHARVLIVGAGGLGCPAATYLTGAGVGHVGLVDDDVVTYSNLPRQVLYAESEVGKSKARAAASRLKAMNGEVEVEVMPFRLTSGNVRKIVGDYDIVVDACDNYATRYLLSDVCGEMCKPYVYGAVEGFCGQVSVFCRTSSSKTYRDLYPEDGMDQRMALSSKGVAGMAPAVIGAVQAHEVLKLVCGYGEVLEGRLWTMDLRTMQSFVIEL